MTKNEFTEWVGRMYLRSCKLSRRYNFHGYKRNIVAVDNKTGKTATAKCHKDDEFNYATGVAIAFARLKGWEVPEIDEMVLPRLKEGDTFFAAGVNGHIYKRTVGKDDFCDLNAFMSERAARVVSAKLKTTMLLERIHEAVCPDYGLDWDKIIFDAEIDRRLSPLTIIRQNGKWIAISATYRSPVETIFPPDIAVKVVAFLNENYACF